MEEVAASPADPVGELDGGEDRIDQVVDVEAPAVDFEGGMRRVRQWLSRELGAVPAA